ncbi:MAG: ATP-binding protein, partial [Kofleriaceae bacterium]
MSKLALALADSEGRQLATIASEVSLEIPDTCVVQLRSSVAMHDRDPQAIANLDISSLTAVTEPVLRLEAELEPELRAAGVHSMIAAPIHARDEVTGVLAVLRRGEPPLDQLDLSLIENLAMYASQAMTNARLRAELVWRMTEPKQHDDRSMFLDAIIENIPDMVFVKDAERLAFVRFNRAGEELLGLNREELLGKTDFDFFPADEAKFFVEKDRETLASKSLVEIPEEPIQTRSGVRWLHTKKVPLVDAKGTPRYLLGISHDITERKRSDARLRAAKETAETASRELEAFANSVTHDLRTPLRGILGFTEALLEDCAEQLDDRGREHLNRLSESANRMATLIDNLLGLSRVSRQELHREVIDLGALAYTAAESLRRSEPARSTEITIQPGLLVDCDRRQLAIVIDHLFSNAWKFTGPRSDARIELGVLERDDLRVFFVRDNGVGFDMAYADRLFGVFQRLHPDEEFPGLGLGLATVSRIVRRHHGRVWAEGVVGEGATIYFTLGEPD